MDHTFLQGLLSLRDSFLFSPFSLELSVRRAFRALLQLYGKAAFYLDRF